MHPKNLSILDFTYPLPDEKIARYPLPERDDARLLIYKDGNITEDIFKNLDHHLPGSSLLVFNDTKVVEARLLFQKPTGAFIEIFCLEPHEQYPDLATALLQQGRVTWLCLIGGASKWKPGQVPKMNFLIHNQEYQLGAKYTGKAGDVFIIELSWTPGHLSFAEILHYAGTIPLPPYLKRKAEASDAERYQTIFANREGSVAAPTAGLHFTPSLMEKLELKKIQPDKVTLHVGAGTFQPVKSEKMSGHNMHAEWIEISKNTIENILLHPDRPVITVGTTSLRAIESLYWAGAKLIARNTGPVPEIMQWDPYEPDLQNIPARQALQSLLHLLEKNNQNRLLTRTQIIIAPGYRPKIARALITNFHLPQSTLLLLVAAVTGGDWKKIYDYALRKHFRFLSYGDSSLLWFAG